MDERRVLVGEVLAPEAAGPRPAARGGRQRTYRRYSAQVVRPILMRVAGGEALSAICAEPGMPTHGTVSGWAKAHPMFGRALARARAASGWPTRTSAGPRFDPAAAQEIYARMCEGESLSSICRDPRMPGHSTVYRWRGSNPAFRALLREARAIQAERLAEAGWEMAEAITPQNAYATEVKLRQLRWMTGVFSPSVFGRFKLVDHESVADTAADTRGPRVLEVRVKRYEKVRREDGSVFLRRVLTEEEEAALAAGAVLPEIGDRAAWEAGGGA